MGEKSFLGTRFFFVTTATAKQGVKLVFFNGIEQGDGLQYISAGIGPFFLNGLALIDGFLHGAHDEVNPEFLYEIVAVLQGFFKIVPGVDMHQRKWYLRRPESFLGQPGHHYGIFSTGKQQCRPLELRHYFTHDENGLVFKLIQMCKLVFTHY